MSEFPLIRSSADEHLPSLPIGELAPNEYRPPRVSFDLLLSGRSPLVYVAERMRNTPNFAVKQEKIDGDLGELLTKTGLGDVTKWYNLLATVRGAGGKLYVIDRQTERYEVIDVIHDFGGETGRLVVRHLGPKSRAGDMEIDIHRGYGYMLPLIVWKPQGFKRRNPDDSLQASLRQFAKTGDSMDATKFAVAFLRLHPTNTLDLAAGKEYGFISIGFHELLTFNNKKKIRSPLKRATAIRRWLYECADLKDTDKFMYYLSISDMEFNDPSEPRMQDMPKELYQYIKYVKQLKDISDFLILE